MLATLFKVDLILLVPLSASQALILPSKLHTQLHLHNPPNIKDVPLTSGRWEGQPLLALDNQGVFGYCLAVEGPVP